MKVLIFDIEANGLNEVTINKKKTQAIKEATRVWCGAIYDVSSGKSTGYKEEEIPAFIRRLEEADLVVGHNILGYDLPLLRRLYGDFNVTAYDTLIVSRLMWPDTTILPRGSHSLESWGLFLGFPKDDYSAWCKKMGLDPWSEWRQEMHDYCIQDTAVTAGVFKYQKEFATKNSKSIKLEHKVADILSKQVENGFGFDIVSAEKLEWDLMVGKASIEDSLQKIFPTIVEERWSDKTGKRRKDLITVFNPGSSKQIAFRFKEKYGWKYPTTKKGNPQVDGAVLKSLDYPEAKLLVTYKDDAKLMTLVSDWILRARASRDGRVHGSFNSLGTVTGRLTSNNPNMQQVSKDKRARSLFIPRSGWSLVGCDLKGLELRMLAHYLYQYDNGAYARQVEDGDIHKHNQEAMGLDSRDSAKTAIFCFLYGGGDAKFGAGIGVSVYAAKKIKQKLLANTPGLKQVIDKCRFSTHDSGAVRPFDWRDIPVRSDHAALNTLLQSSGAHIAKLWACYIHDSLNKLFPNQWNWVGNIHDEVQIECSPDIAHDLGREVVACAAKAGNFFNCKIKIDAEYLVGANWSETH